MKTQITNFMIPLFLVILGIATAGFGYWKNFDVITTMGSQAFAAGLALLTKETHQSLTNQPGGTVNITPDSVDASKLTGDTK
jgi:hypothetical protein